MSSLRACRALRHGTTPVWPRRLPQTRFPDSCAAPLLHLLPRLRALLPAFAQDSAPPVGIVWHALCTARARPSAAPYALVARRVAPHRQPSSDDDAWARSRALSTSYFMPPVLGQQFRGARAAHERSAVPVHHHQTNLPHHSTTRRAEPSRAASRQPPPPPLSAVAAHAAHAAAATALPSVPASVSIFSGKNRGTRTGTAYRVQPYSCTRRPGCRH